MRICNMSARDTCEFCLNEGLVMVGTRAEGTRPMEMYGPCPHCERGFRIEFPDKDRPRWENGYWQGRDVDVQPAPKLKALLGRDENGIRSILLTRRYKKIEGADPLVGLEFADPRERMKVLLTAIKATESAAKAA